MRGRTVVLFDPENRDVWQTLLTCCDIQMLEVALQRLGKLWLPSSGGWYEHKLIFPQNPLSMNNIYFEKSILPSLQKKKKLQKFNTIMKMATKMVSKWSIKIRLKNLKTEANYVLFPFHFQLALIWSFILFSPGPNLNALMPQPYKNAPSQSNLNFLSECWVFFKEMLCCPFVTDSASWRWIIRMLLSPILKETHSAIMSAWCRVLCVLL